MARNFGRRLLNFGRIERRAQSGKDSGFRFGAYLFASDAYLSPFLLYRTKVDAYLSALGKRGNRIGSYLFSSALYRAKVHLYRTSSDAYEFSSDEERTSSESHRATSGKDILKKRRDEGDLSKIN